MKIFLLIAHQINKNDIHQIVDIIQKKFNFTQKSQNIKNIFYIFLDILNDYSIHKFTKYFLEILNFIKSTNISKQKFKKMIKIFFKINKIEYTKKNKQNFLVKLFNQYLDVLSTIIPEKKFNLKIEKIKKINSSLINNIYYK